jgi:hypothetical protein
LLVQGPSSCGHRLCGSECRWPVSRAGARTRASAVRAYPSESRGLRASAPHPCGQRSACGQVDCEECKREAMVRWVQGFGPRLQAHVPPEFPWWSREQHIAAARLQAELVRELCGERPTVFVAIQWNGKRGHGWHSHCLLCGSDRLLEARRSIVWREMVRRCAAYPGEGQPGAWLRTAAGGREWTPSVPNGLRYRLTPIFEGPSGDREIVSYCVRYCLREDVETCLEVLPGDRAADTFDQVAGGLQVPPGLGADQTVGKIV